MHSLSASPSVAAADTLAALTVRQPEERCWRIGTAEAACAGAADGACLMCRRPVVVLADGDPAKASLCTWIDAERDRVALNFGPAAAHQALPLTGDSARFPDTAAACQELESTAALRSEQLEQAVLDAASSGKWQEYIIARMRLVAWRCRHDPRACSNEEYRHADLPLIGQRGAKFRADGIKTMALQQSLAAGDLLLFVRDVSDHVLRAGSQFDPLFPGTLVSSWRPWERRFKTPFALLWLYDETARALRNDDQSLPQWQRDLPLLPVWTWSIPAVGETTSAFAAAILADCSVPLDPVEGDMPEMVEVWNLARSVRCDGVYGLPFDSPDKKQLAEACLKYRTMYVRTSVALSLNAFSCLPESC